MRNSDFAWDDGKARRNYCKHGVSFLQATAIWSDPFCLCMKVCNQPESRWVAIGRVGKRRILSAIFTYRGDSPGRVRIISARKATNWEENAYYGHSTN